MFKKLFDENKDYFKEKSYKKGEVIFLEGDKCDKVGLIIKGGITITTLTYLENDYTINSLRENETFGDLIVFSNNPIYQGDVIARATTVVSYISKENLLFLLNNTKTLNDFLFYVSNKTMFIQNRLKTILQKTIREKILFFLKEQNTNIVYINSKENLAKYLNIPRPSLSRELINMKDEGIIDYDKYKIILKV